MHKRIAARACMYVGAALTLAYLLPNKAGAGDAAVKLTCQPVAQRTQDIGCWILAAQRLGPLSDGPAYWHLHAYPTRAAAEAAKAPNQTLVESVGRVWLMAIAPQNWQAKSGERVGVIGPLETERSREYTAQYMEAIFPPGFDTPVHRHPGPEAWYTVAGEVCLETPEGKAMGRAGDTAGVIVRGGLPMRLSVTGTQERRSIVLILHDSSQPHTTLASDWKPQGLCRS